MLTNSTFSPLQDSNSRKLLLIYTIVYLFTAKGYLEVSDTNYSLQTAESLVKYGQLAITPSPGATFTAANGNSYSKYGIGLAAIYVPLVWFSQRISTTTGLPPNEIAGFLISFLNIPFAILTVIVFGKLLGRFGTSPKYARLLMTGLAFGTLCWRYAVYDFSEGMQTSLLLLAVCGLVISSRQQLILGGLGFAGLVLIKLVHAALLPICVTYLLWHPGTYWRSRIKAVIVFTAPVILALGVIAWLNLVRFGNALESGYGSEARQFIPSQLLYTLPRLIGSLDKGLFLFCPILILGLLGWIPFIRRFPREAGLCTGLVIANLVLAGAWHSWVGGWSWGPRLVVPAIPLWLLPAGCAFSGTPSRSSRRWIACLVLISALFQVPGVLVKGQQIHQIRFNELAEAERQAFPSDWSAAWLVLQHKLQGAPEVYTLAEFGVPGERTIDLTKYRTYQGLNVWTEHVARQYRIPLLRWLPLMGLAIGCLICFRIATAEKAQEQMEESSPAKTDSSRIIREDNGKNHSKY